MTDNLTPRSQWLTGLKAVEGPHRRLHNTELGPMTRAQILALLRRLELATYRNGTRPR